MRKTARQVATAVCHVMGGSTADRVLAPQRGTPRTAYLRALSMWLWRNQDDTTPTYTATGEAFGRDRRNVVRGLERLGRENMPRAIQLNHILERLR